VTLLKSIVVCLVLANVGYFLWARGIAKTPEAPASSVPASTLKLASESSETPRAASPDAGSTAAGVVVAAGGGHCELVSCFCIAAQFTPAAGGAGQVTSTV